MSNKAGRTHTTESPSSQPSGVNWLLVIAIDDYDPAIGKLYNCVKDVRAFMDVVTQRYHFDTKHIIPLINADATAEGIEAAFRKLLTIKPEDNLVIYYSGHGDYDNDIDLGYWIPADATNRRQGLHNDFITRFLNRIPSRHTLLLCDSCFSGSLLLDEPTKVISPRYYTQPSRWAITSGAKELVSDGKEHSPFAKALLRVLNQSTGDVDIVTLGRAIMEEVAANERQKPLFAPMRVSGHQGGMFVFFQKQDETRDWEAAQQENTIPAYTHFRRTYPNSVHSAEAKQRIKALEEDADWQKALRRNKVSDYEDYLDDYPNGKYVQDAHQRIEALLNKPPTPTIQVPKPEIIPPKEKETIIIPRIRTNELEPEMVFVPGGTFKMGSNDYDSEKPIHDVTVKDFYIGKYPVTQAEWRAVMGSDPPNLKFKGCDRCPVENVSWNDVQEFIKKLNKQSDKKYRLPSEAEWEYAARGGSGVSPSGARGQGGAGFKYAGSNNLDEVGWYDKNSDNKTHPVGQKKPNELGIYDMSGNVWEWCEDVWHNNYKDAPTNGSAWMSGGNQARRVVRGGSWINVDNLCRVSDRVSDFADDRNYLIGFRLAGY